MMNTYWSRIYSSSDEQSSVLKESWAQEHQDAFRIDAKQHAQIRNGALVCIRM